MEITNLTIPILVGAAIIDSINPCAFGVLIFLIAYLFKTFHTHATVLIHGLTYTLAVFLTYLAAGLILLPVLEQFGMFATATYVVIGALLIIAGILEVKDFFFYGWGPTLSIAPFAAKRIEIYTKRVTGKLSTSFFLGVFVALVELPCTGAVYLGVLALISLAGLTFNHFLLLVLYNLFFILPLLVILFLVHSGGQIKKFEAWRERYRGYMRLAIGVLLVVMGTWMINFIL